MRLATHTSFASILLVTGSILFLHSGDVSAQGASARDAIATTEPVLDNGTISYATSWRIKLDKQAESDGELVFRIVQKDDASDATRISITIVKGATKADIAKIIEDALKSKAPTGIKIERNGDDEIVLTATAGASISLDKNTIADLDIKLSKDVVTGADK